VVEYGLPIKNTTEVINGTEYYYTWKGDEIIGACPNASDRPIYPQGEECK